MTRKPIWAVWLLVLLPVAALPAEQMVVTLTAGGTKTYNITDIRSITFKLSGNSIQNDVQRVADLQKVLANIFPNPFHGMTTIRYTLHQDADVNVTIFDTKGQQVKTLVEQRVKAGSYTAQWNATDRAGRDVASGQYIARIVINGSLTTVHRVFLLK
jgi:hypothetical protein